MRIDGDIPVPNSRRTALARHAPWAAAAWAGAIFAASSLPGSAVPGRFGALAHFLEYAVLGALLLVARADERDHVGEFVTVVALASAWGVTDELHQSFVALRVADPMDWLVDSAGAAAGCLALLAARRASAGRRKSL